MSLDPDVLAKKNEVLLYINGNNLSYLTYRLNVIHKKLQIAVNFDGLDKDIAVMVLDKIKLYWERGMLKEVNVLMDQFVPHMSTSRKDKIVDILNSYRVRF